MRLGATTSREEPSQWNLLLRRDNELIRRLWDGARGGTVVLSRSQDPINSRIHRGYLY